MATVDECRQALHDLAGRLGDDPASKVNLDRALACHVTDLDHYFHGRLRDGRLVEIADGDDPAAAIRLSIGGDDLRSLVAGRLHFAAAWASGRLLVKASFGDLLKLRKLL